MEKRWEEKIGAPLILIGEVSTLKDCEVVRKRVPQQARRGGEWLVDQIPGRGKKRNDLNFL